MLRRKNVLLMLVLLVCFTFTLSLSLYGCSNDNDTDANADIDTDVPVVDNGIYRIHFLNVTNSDAMLIESNGKFGMVDCAEDSDNPRGFANLNLVGHEKAVIEYVKKVAGDENGKVTLDFVLGTHAHSDHLGGFDTLISDPDITVKRAYLKRYFPDNIISQEVNTWDNQEVYDQMVEAIKNEEGCLLIQDDLDHRVISEDMGWGANDFKLTLFNGMDDHDMSKRIGENENSICMLIEKNGKNAFLTGDMNNLEEQGDEDRVAKELTEDYHIDHIDVLKAGHHGHPGSNTPGYLHTIKPVICVVPNRLSALFPATKATLNELNTQIFGAVDNGGIIVDFTKDGIKLYNGNNEQIY